LIPFFKIIHKLNIGNLKKFSLFAVLNPYGFGKNNYDRITKGARKSFNLSRKKK
jgi:hypothetical protein